MIRSHLLGSISTHTARTATQWGQDVLARQGMLMPLRRALMKAVPAEEPVKVAEPSVSDIRRIAQASAKRSRRASGKRGV